jgi:hypothetical protein
VASAATVCIRAGRVSTRTRCRPLLDEKVLDLQACARAPVRSPLRCTREWSTLARQDSVPAAPA